MDKKTLSLRVLLIRMSVSVLDVFVSIRSIVPMIRLPAIRMLLRKIEISYWKSWIVKI